VAALPYWLCLRQFSSSFHFKKGPGNHPRLIRLLCDHQLNESGRIAAASDTTTSETSWKNPERRSDVGLRLISEKQCDNITASLTTAVLKHTGNNNNPR